MEFNADEVHEIRQLLSDYEEGCEEEQEGASKAGKAAADLEALGVDPDNPPDLPTD